MPISVHPHLDLERLLDRLIPELARAQADLGHGNAPLAPLPIVVPSRQLADWLQTRLARRTGLCMGLEFLQPQEFIQRVLAAESRVAAATDQPAPWSPENLVWRLLPHMDEFAPQLGLAGADRSPRDLFALARLIADQFDQYAHFRPEIVEQWAAGQPAPARATAANQSARDAEPWQRDLWRKLHDALAALPTPQPHPALQLAELSASGRADAAAAAFPRLFVVGLGTLDPMLVRILRLLGESGAEIATHAVLPSLHYLDDLRRRTETLDTLRADPDAEPPADGHPLLLSHGRQAIGAFLLLGELDPEFHHWPDIAALDEPSGELPLLARLQADIRSLRDPRRQPVRPPLAAGDRSLQLHACHGPRREIEVLRDELLRAFAELPGLQPEEVVIVTADPAPYAPLVEAILRRGTPPLPVRLTELPPGEQNALTEALLALLDFSRGRWPASGLIELLHLRACRRHLALDDDKTLARLHQWIVDSGLTEEGTHAAPGAESPWLEARDRLIAGAWFGSDCELRYPESASGATFVLPVASDLESDDALRAAFTLWHSQLTRALQLWKTPAPPAEWSERLGNAYDALLASDDDEAELPELRAALHQLATQTDCAVAVDAGTMLDWLLSRREAHATARTSFTGETAFGRFKQLQNQPCRVLAMVGMQDGNFPRQARVPAWDLLQLVPQRWDRNPRIEDRQLFLDALLCPSDRLIVTASSQNLRTGKQEPFSACVDELLRAAAATVELPRHGTGEAPGEALVVRHKLYPFSSHYFRADSALPRSHDANAHAIARSLAAQTGGAAPRAHQPLYTAAPAAPAPEPDNDVVALADLIRFWKDPARFWLKAQGIALPWDEGDDRELDRVPLNLDPLQSWQLDTELVAQLRCQSPDAARARLAASRLISPGSLGLRQWEQIAPPAQTLAALLQTLAPAPQPVECAGAAGMPRIFGSVSIGKHRGAPYLVAFSVRRFASHKHWLAPWISAVAAGAAERPEPSLLLGQAAHVSQTAQRLPAIPREAAEPILAALLDGFRQGRERPLGYAPNTSASYLDKLKGATEADPSALQSAADAKWFHEKSEERPEGEGQKPAAQLAWRDRDPFAADQLDDWHHWSRGISAPLQAWVDAATDEPL
ncbi:MAG: exodeoxyribonuclease V subunit gamma [Opitutaceae bacterium]|nr:exodeoxyribonuclease V subunit gamma [Opitutaceae bacterium]